MEQNVNDPVFNAEPAAEAPVEKRVCFNCGAEVAPDERFCTACGADQMPPAPEQPVYQPAPEQPVYQPAPEQPVYQPAPEQPVYQPQPQYNPQYQQQYAPQQPQYTPQQQYAPQQPQYQQQYAPQYQQPQYAPAPQPEQKKKSPLPVILGVVGGVIVLAAIAVVLFFVLGGKRVTDITVNKSEVVLDIGDVSEQMSYNIYPSDAKNQNVTWSSSNEKIATVDANGRITAVEAGSCTITVKSNNGKTADIKVTVKEHVPTFLELFPQYKGMEWADFGADGSWLSLDTNPSDYDDDSYSYLFWFSANFDAVKSAINAVNKALGFTDALYQHMSTTTWSQGRQSEENENYKVSWTYHPDKGLEVTYELKNK